jgi:hypothetical protein
MSRKSIDETIDEFLEEAAREADEDAAAPSETQLYYWLVSQGPFWQQREVTEPAWLTDVAAGNRHVAILDRWSRQLGRSGGLLYVARYVWTGRWSPRFAGRRPQRIWRRDRCDLRNLSTMRSQACTITLPSPIPISL